MDSEPMESYEHLGRGVVPGACVRLSDVPARVGAPAERPLEPSIEFVRSGEVIRAIDIVCVCGQHIRLHCLYK